MVQSLTWQEIVVDIIYVVLKMVSVGNVFNIYLIIPNSQFELVFGLLHIENETIFLDRGAFTIVWYWLTADEPTMAMGSVKSSRLIRTKFVFISKSSKKSL